MNLFTALGLTLGVGQYLVDALLIWLVLLLTVTSITFGPWVGRRPQLQ